MCKLVLGQDIMQLYLSCQSKKHIISSNALLRMRIICLSIILLLYSCEEKKNYFDHEFSSSDTLVIDDLNREFVKLKNSDELPVFITNLIKSNSNNITQIEEWFEEQWDEGNITFDAFSTEQAKELLELLFDFNKNELRRAWTYSLLKQNRIKEDIQVRGLAYVHLAKEYKFQKNQDSLSKYVQLLGEVKEKDTSSFINLSYHLHNAYLPEINGNFLEAIISYYKALEFVRDDDTNRLSTIHQNIANLYIEMDQVDKAYHYIQESIRYKPWQEMALDHLNTIGIIFRKYGDYEESEKVFQKLIQVANEKKIDALLAQTYSNYANLKVNQKKYDEALEFFTKSDSICQSIQLSIGTFFNIINRGSLYLNQKQFTESATYFEQAYSLFDNFQIPRVEVIILKGLYESYEGLNQKAIAFEYYKRYITQKEKLLGDAPNTLIAEWKLSQSEYSNKINEARLQALSKQQKLHQVIFGFILFTILLIVLFTFMNQKKKKTIKEQKLQQKQQEIAHQLEIKTKELLSESVKNLSIQNTKNNIHAELRAILNELPKTHSQKFDSLMRTLKVNTEQQFIDEFDSRLVGVYESFYQKIIEMAPSLTPNEIRICAMMKLNISSKEMAALTNRTPGTIENIRSDIRKKLKVPSHINLQDFILKL